MESIYSKIVELRAQGVPLIVVTAVEKQGAGPVDVGKKMIVTEAGRAFGTVGGGALEHYAIDKCKELLNTHQHLLEKYLLEENQIIPETQALPMACGGVVTLFYEYQGPKANVFIFGAGHVGQALVNVLKTMPFFVTVVDNRQEILEGFQHADRVVLSGFSEYIDKESLPNDAFVVVCTPSHAYDYHIINKVIEHQLHPAYLGMLCSKQKLEQYLEKTYETYGHDVDLSKFYAPVGLDLGGNTPEEIAISITSEILAILNGKQGHVHMRESIGGHDRYW